MNLARMLMASSSVPAVSYIGLTSDATNQSTYVFSAVDIGTAATDRLVVIGVFAERGNPVGTVTSVTGSVSGAFGSVGAANNSGDYDTLQVALYSKRISTGTAEDITVVLSSIHADCAIAVWNITGQTSDTVVATDNGTTTPISLSLAATAANSIIAISYSNNNSASCVWSNDVTENFDTAVDNVKVTGSMGNSLTTGTKTATATWSTSITRVSLAALWQ